MLRISSAIAILAACASCAWAGIGGYEFLSDWASLPRDRTRMTAGLASSYDRGGGNNDYNQYLWPSGFLNTAPHDGVSTVVADITGPGVLTRFWMPHYSANGGFPMRIYVDGALAINTDSNTYLDGHYGYAAAPLVQTLLGGQVSYEPIVFSQSLRIESANYLTGLRAMNYYQYGYYRLPANSQVAPYSGSLTADQQAKRNAVVSMINNVGQNPAPPAAGQSALTAAQAIAPGLAVSIASLSGSGHVSRLNVKLPAGVSDAQVDGLRLQVRYDGSSSAAIDVSVSQFFGAGHGRVAYKSLPMGTDSADGFYCYWPMPYRQGAQIQLVNSTGAPIAIESAAVEYQAGAVGRDEGYLHAAFAEETITFQSAHTLLNVSGKGQYVGNLLFLEKPGSVPWLLEGDDIITVNPGTANQTVLYGTGLEDAYNSGFYYNHVAELSGEGETPDPAYGIGPYHGLLGIDFYDMPGFTRTRTDQYRWLIGDAVPFTDGINVKVENYGGENVHFGSTAFYYADFLPPPHAGDATGDDRVNVDDLGILASHYGAGTSLSWPDGDFTDDGVVNVDDLGILATNYDWVGPGAAGVPEPATLCLLAVGGLSLLRRRWRVA